MPKLKPAWVALVMVSLVAGGVSPSTGQVLSAGPLETPGLLAAGPGRDLLPTPMLHMSLPALLSDDGDVDGDIPLILLFNTGSDRLTVTATRVLDRLGLALNQGTLARRRLKIIGHADIAGSAEARRDMARRRAQAVALYLEQNYNIEAARLRCLASPAPTRQGRLVLIAAMTP